MSLCERERNQHFRFWLTPMWLLNRKKKQKNKVDNITLNHVLQHIQISVQSFQWTEFVQVYRELNQKEEDLSK